MGCEHHPDQDGRIFVCTGDLTTVFRPYFKGKNGTEYPHWNGARAFTDEKSEILPTLSETGLAAVGLHLVGAPDLSEVEAPAQLPDRPDAIVDVALPEPARLTWSVS